jgi:hypothetical protein
MADVQVVPPNALSPENPKKKKTLLSTCATIGVTTHFAHVLV